MKTTGHHGADLGCPKRSLIRGFINKRRQAIILNVRSRAADTGIIFRDVVEIEV